MATLEVTDAMNAISTEFPSFKLRSKSTSWSMKVIDVLLRALTLNKQKSFMKTFTTTIGYTVYTPESWLMMSSRGQVVILRHEAVHMRQRKKYGFLVFSFLYLFAWLPVWRAKWRRDFEMEAYEESLRTLYRFGEDIANIVLRTRMLSHFTTAEYGWMWTKEEDIEAWYDRTVQRIMGEKKN
jgi:hypothetical protein